MRARIRVFLDSSALIAGVVSASGGAHAILALAEAGKLEILVSRQVLVECERNLRAKLPRSVALFSQIVQAVNPTIVSDPPFERVQAVHGWIEAKDAVVLAAAMSAKPDYLVSLDRRHFLEPSVAQRSGLRIGTAGDFLAWLREQTANA